MQQEMWSTGGHILRAFHNSLTLRSDQEMGEWRLGGH